MASYVKRKVKSGFVWDIRFRIMDNGKVTHKSLNGYPTKKEAEFAYMTFKKTFEPSYKECEDLFFSELCDRYKEYIGSRLKESSIESITRSINQQLLPYFEKLKVSDITKLDIISWQTELNKKNYKFNYKSKAHARLVAIFNFAIDFYDYPTNPASKAKNFKNNDIQEPMLFWTEQEFKIFIKAVNNITFKTIFSLLYLTGCRRGELLALTWQDIASNKIIINKTCSFHSLKNTYNITSPKNRSSNRIILMPDSLTKLVNEYKEFCKPYEGFSETSFLFFINKPMPPETLRRNLHRYCENAEVKKIRIHDFRHSHASLLINSGNNVLAVAQRLGHSDIEQTLNRYSHFFDKEQEKLLESINIIL